MSPVAGSMAIPREEFKKASLAGHPSPTKFVAVGQMVGAELLPTAMPPAKVVMMPCVSTLRTQPAVSVMYRFPRLSVAIPVGFENCTAAAVAGPLSPGIDPCTGVVALP